MRVDLNLKCAHAGCTNHFRIEVETSAGKDGITSGRLQQLAIDLGWQWPSGSAPLCPEHRQP